MTIQKRPRRTASSKTRAKPAPRKATRVSAKKTGVRSLPALTLPTTGGKSLRLSDLKGKRVVLYFYPKDDTPGCALESCDIRDQHREFTRRHTVVLGVSRDSLTSHEQFKSKYGLPFELLSDLDEKLCRVFDVIKKKSLYGRKYLGIERSTFVFDENGKLRQAFRGVKVPGHVQQILNELDKL